MQKILNTREMRGMNILKIVTVLSVILLTFSCSSENEIEPKDDRSFITDATTDFFINRDGTVNLTVTGSFTDSGIAGETIRRGFVYGTSSKPEVNADNTEPLLGNNPMYTSFGNLEAGQIFFIRGFFEISDCTFFYGEEIQASTNVNAKTSRSITMNIKPELFFKNSEGITPELVVTAVEKESPVDIGFEYSVYEDFSDSSITLDNDMSGNIFLTTYSEFIEGLTPGTLYYFRSYAKYADGTTTNGGTSTASFTTNQ